VKQLVVDKLWIGLFHRQKQIRNEEITAGWNTQIGLLYQLNVLLTGHQYNRKRKGQRNFKRKEGKEKGNGNECFIDGFYCNA
jgi:hypothetical protein